MSKRASVDDEKEAAASDIQDREKSHRRLRQPSLLASHGRFRWSYSAITSGLERASVQRYFLETLVAYPIYWG